jgi:hypothetical protein
VSAVRSQRLSRRERRALQRRADRILDRLNWYPIAAKANADAAPRTHAVLAGEGEPVLIPRKHIIPAFISAGLCPLGLEEALAEIADADDGRRFPVLIYLDGCLQCAWMELRALSSGGDA